MSQSTPNPNPTPNQTPNSNPPTLPVPEVRTMETIQIELDAARAECQKLRTIDEAHQTARNAAIRRRDRLESQWRKENPGEPFDASVYGDRAVVPSPQSSVSDRYHAIHYVIAKLESDLISVRNAMATITPVKV